MKKIFNKSIKIVLPIVLGALILYMIYSDFSFSQLWEELKGMDMWWFAVSTFFGIMSHVIRGWRWKLALEPLGFRLSSRVSVYSIFVAYAANLVVPRVGEVSRCVILEQYEKVPFAQSLGTVVTERAIDTFMVLLLTVVAVLLQWPVFYRFVADAGLGLDGNSFFTSMGGWIVVLLSLVAIMLLAYLLLRKMALWAKLKAFFSNFMNGLLSLKKVKNAWLYVLETVGIWFCYFMQFYLCFFCFSFSSNLSLLAGLLLFVAGSIAVVVPTPNGMGPWHFAIISIMVLYGVSENNASVFALIVHSSQTLLVALLGVYALIMLQIRQYFNKKN
ncbi:MAG: flippase-like domain-containing protein [Bacteroidaceae bacterium]|nr:flippase-like domain-containing protein [Bacteroidaceae bacterium]